MPVLSGRIITPSSSDPMALVAVYNGEIVSWLWKLHFFLFCFDFVTWFCHNLNRRASLLRNVLTENQTASFYFQVGLYSAVLSHHFARTKYMYILAELSREARSEAPWVKKCGKLLIPENLVITWSYTDRPPARPTDRPHHRHTNVK